MLVGGDLPHGFHPALPLDVSTLATDRPSTLVFFRPGAGMLGFATPWTNVPSFALPGSIRLDVMHVMDLGVTARWVGTAVRKMFQAKAWGNNQGHRLAKDLRKHWRDVDRRAKALTGSRRKLVSRLPKGSGFAYLTGTDANDPRSKAKAMENRDLVRYLVAKLESMPKGVFVGKNALLYCGRCLEEMHGILREKRQRVVDPATADRFLQLQLLYLTRWKNANFHTTIKNHYAVHLADQALPCCAAQIIHGRNM
jgi:hypothetical protein